VLGVEAGAGVLEPLSLAISASAIPATIRSGTPISAAISHGLRFGSGCAMTCVTASPATGTRVPESKPTSVRPSGGRSAGDLAIDSSATAASLVGASGRSE
jgi:hypothetical protein